LVILKKYINDARSYERQKPAVVNTLCDADRQARLIFVN